MIKRYFILFVGIVYICISCSPSEEEKELARINEINDENYQECLNYDFSRDSSVVSFLIVEQDTSRYTLAPGINNGDLLLGGLLFNESKCFFRFLAIFNDLKDTLDVQIKGSYTSNFEFIDEKNVLEGSDYLTFNQVNTLSINSDTIPNFSLNDMQHTIECTSFNFPTHIIDFTYNGYDTRVFFNQFE